MTDLQEETLPVGKMQLLFSCSSREVERVAGLCARGAIPGWRPCWPGLMAELEGRTQRNICQHGSHTEQTLESDGCVARRDRRRRRERGMQKGGEACEGGGGERACSVMVSPPFAFRCARLRLSPKRVTWTARPSHASSRLVEGPDPRPRSRSRSRRSARDQAVAACTCRKQLRDAGDRRQATATWTEREKLRLARGVILVDSVRGLVLVHTPRRLDSRGIAPSVNH